MLLSNSWGSIVQSHFVRRRLLHGAWEVAMAGKTSIKSKKVAAKESMRRRSNRARQRPSRAKTAPKSRSRKVVKPALLAGGNPQIAKADGDAPVQAYIAAMPGWKRDVGRRLDALIVRTVPGVRKAVKWNSPLLRRRGPGLVPRLPLLHEVRQGGFLPRHVAASGPARRVQEQGRALPRHPRGRRARRSSVRRLGEASQPVARRTNVTVAVARCVA